MYIKLSCGNAVFIPVVLVSKETVYALVAILGADVSIAVNVTICTFC